MIHTHISSLLSVLEFERGVGKTIAWTNGCFDIMHPGHIETFRQSKLMADVLVVGINSDCSPYWITKPGRPINDQDFRLTMVDAIRYVDHVILFDGETPIIPISKILPNFLIKGGDYESSTVVGGEEVGTVGGKVVIIPTVGSYSTTSIVNKIRNATR